MATTREAISPVTCPNCNGRVSAGARFCGACGQQIPRPAAAAGPEAPPDPQTPAGRAPGTSGVTWRHFFMVMMSPGSIIEGMVGQTSWAAALAVSGLAFALFFFQTGLDKARVSGGGVQGAAILGAAGIFYGTLGVALVGALAWVLSRPFGGQRSLSWVIRAFSVSYSPALIYAGLGLPFNLLLGWNTAVAFGVTGLLWALGPMVSTIRSMTDGRTGVSVVLATVCGGVLLYGWSFLSSMR